MNRVSLFDELKSGGYETSIITTFNIDFPFFEDVILRRMQSTGIQHHIVLADKSMCLQSLLSRPPVRAGHQYSLAPMKCSAAFHPKLMLLLGKNKGFLAVGSHNLTLSGFGNNLEVSNIIRFHRTDNVANLALFRSAISACTTWLNDYGEGVPQGVLESFNKIPDVCTWLKNEPAEQDETAQLLYSSKSTSSLWRQVDPLIEKPVQHIFGQSAFFDKSLRFVKTLSSLTEKGCTFAIQPETVHAPKELLKQEQAIILNSNSLLTDVDSHYIHAKLMYIQSENESVLISGSANLSAPAWLAEEGKGNAEAILLRKGESVKQAYEGLGFSDLSMAEPVSVINNFIENADSEDEHTIIFLIITYQVGLGLSIPWSDTHKEVNIYYQDDLAELMPVPFSIKPNSLLISDEVLQPGRVLLIHHNGVLHTSVLMHHEQQIRENSSTGKERRLRQALGSIATDSPDMNIIFDSISLLMVENNNHIKSSVKKNSTTQTQESNTPDTLLSEFNERHNKSGRLKLHSSGDIGLFMDILIKSLDDGESVKAGLNEDDFGRTEEELIGKDDKQSTEQEDVDNEEKQEIIKALIHKRLKTMIDNKLNDFLEAKGDLGIQACLAVVVFCYRLQQTNHEWVDTDTLKKLFSILCANLFSEKNPFYSSIEDENGPFESDDWGRLLGYSVWLAYYSGVAWRKELPVSSQKDQKESVIWGNACWLYFSQRLVSDKLAKEISGRLVNESQSEKIQQWYNALIQSGEILHTEGKLPGSDFDLASSVSEAFDGLRLVVDLSLENIPLGSVSGIGKHNIFTKSALQIVN